MIIAIAILLVILGFGGAVSIDSYKGYLFHSERELVISALTRARSLSLSNVSALPHGVCYESTTHQYIIFQGTNCIPGDANNETLPGSHNILVSGLSSPVVFSELAATTTAAMIHLSDGVRSADITINYEGRINW